MFAGITTKISMGDKTGIQTLLEHAFGTSWIIFTYRNKKCAIKFDIKLFKVNWRLNASLAVDSWCLVIYQLTLTKSISWPAYKVRLVLIAALIRLQLKWISVYLLSVSFDRSDANDATLQFYCIYIFEQLKMQDLCIWNCMICQTSRQPVAGLCRHEIQICA